MYICPLTLSGVDLDLKQSKDSDTAPPSLLPYFSFAILATVSKVPLDPHGIGAARPGVEEATTSKLRLEWLLAAEGEVEDISRQ